MRREAGRDPAAFESAQRDLFEEVGLDTRSRFIDHEAPAGRTHVFEAGPADDDVALVFVHGTAAFGAFLAPLMARFDDTRTIAFDRPGYGLSDPFVYTTGNLRRTVVDMIEGVLDGVGLRRVTLVGHSMGGHAGVLFALEHPDRVERLVTLGALPGFPGTRPPLPLRLMTVPVIGRVVRRLQKSGEEGVLDIAELFGEREAIRAHPALIRALAANEADPKPSRAGFSEFDALFSIRGWHPPVRITEAHLRELRHPTTVIWGDNDPLEAPDAVRDYVDLIPDVRFETVDAGHMPYLGHGERCAQLIRD